MTSSRTPSKTPVTRRGFGRIERLPSGRFRAGYTGPDGLVHRPDQTFEGKLDAEAWLADRRREIVNRTWNAPAEESAKVKVRPMTFGEYAEAWLEHRDLKPRTRSHYRSVYANYLAPTFADMPLTRITPGLIRSWHTTTAVGRPTTRAHAYGLLRTILGTAVNDEVLAANPAHIRGAGAAKRKHKVEPLSLAQLEALVEAMPAKHQVLTLLAAWCGLRFGELTELRRKDVDLKAAVLRVRRGVVRVDGQRLVGDPKSEAGVRDVNIPPHLVPLVRAHIEEYAAWGRDGLVFPGANGHQLAPSSLYGRATTPHKAGWGFYKARVDAGVPGLRWHDLRHTGAVLAASTGATLAELMARLGHSTPGAALRYQHAAADRDKAIAAALSGLAGARHPLPR